MFIYQFAHSDTTSNVTNSGTGLMVILVSVVAGVVMLVAASILSKIKGGTKKDGQS